MTGGQKTELRVTEPTGLEAEQQTSELTELEKLMDEQRLTELLAELKMVTVLQLGLVKLVPEQGTGQLT